MISTSLLSIGLENILGGKKAFINFDYRLLSERIYRTLPPQLTIIEVLESVEPTADLIALCRSIREDGYTIALDDFDSASQIDPLVHLAQLIKIDVRATSRLEQERLVKAYRPRGISLVAEKVETYEEFDWARSAGFDYFQGYFFARPSILRSSHVPAAKLTCLRLVSETQKPELDLKLLETLIRGDVALSYKLLRFANSALFGRHGEIHSIRHALVVLGTERIRRLVALAALPTLTTDKPTELATLSLIRARFCERLIPGGSALESQAFLMGLFSLLGALLDRPLDEALRSISLGSDITEALLGTAGDRSRLSVTYQLARSYELGDWEGVENLAQTYKINTSSIGDAYVEAAGWAAQILQLAENKVAPRSGKS